MRVIAKAKPNQDYYGILSIYDMVLEARIIRGRIKFFETHVKKPNWVVELKEETVRAMFPNGETPHHERPFLTMNNRGFFTVLNRNDPKHHDHFLKIAFPKYEISDEESLPDNEGKKDS